MIADRDRIRNDAAEVSVLLIDKTSIRKRHRYVTVVVNGDPGEVLAMLQGRSKAAVSGFLIEQTQSNLPAVRLLDAHSKVWGGEAKADASCDGARGLERSCLLGCYAGVAGK